MDNILYIGPYREFSGEGNASRNYLKALIRTGHNISARPIYNLFKPYYKDDIDPDILDLETNSSKKYHTVIQHANPHQFVYSSKFDKNIGIAHLDSSNYYSNISDYFNIMDTVVVGSLWLKKQIYNIPHIQTKIINIPEPIDLLTIEEYKTNNTRIKKDNNFKFYAIADYTQRKNIDNILLAFLLLSQQFSDIDLVLKLKNRANDNNVVESTVQYNFEKIYMSLRTNEIKKPKILFGGTKYNSILFLHHNNDCLINTSYGESFGYSCLEAMSFNNNIITTSDTGSEELADNHCGLLVDSRATYCSDPERQYSIYNTIDQKWSEPNLKSIIQQMSYALNESQKDKENRIQKQKEKLEKYTIDVVSKQFMEII